MEDSDKNLQQPSPLPVSCAAPPDVHGHGRSLVSLGLRARGRSGSGSPSDRLYWVVLGRPLVQMASSAVGKSCPGLKEFQSMKGPERKGTGSANVAVRLFSPGRQLS